MQQDLITEEVLKKKKKKKNLQWSLGHHQKYDEGIILIPKYKE